MEHDCSICTITLGQSDLVFKVMNGQFCLFSLHNLFCTQLRCVNDVNSTQPFLGNVRRSTSFSTNFHPFLRIHEILVGFIACLLVD